MSITEDSPSARRRKALKEADATNQLRVLGSCPLPKYIDIADRLLEHFQDAVDGRRLDEAYIFGLRFANLCLSSLPQHPEWKRDTSKRDRKRLTSSVGDVLSMMDVIKQRMDAEELMKIKAEFIVKQEEEARKKQEDDRLKQQLEEASQREQKIRDTLEQERAQFLAEQRAIRQEEIKVAKAKEKAAKKNDIEKSAMAKLQAMQAHMSSTAEHAPPKEDLVASKKKAEKTKSNKAKTTDFKKKMPFVRAEKKANVKPEEETAKLATQTPTQAMAKLHAMQDHMPSTAEQAPPKEDLVVSKKKDGKTKSIKAKTTDSKKKMPFARAKKKANVKPKEETAKLATQTPTQSQVIDSKDVTSTLLAASTAERGAGIPQSHPSSTGQEENRRKNSERILSKGEDEKEIATSVPSQEIEIEPEVDENESKIVPNQEPKSIPSNSIRFKFKKNDSDSTRSETSQKSTKKITPINFIRSKIETVKSSIPTMPSATMLMKTSTKNSANDNVDVSSTNISVNGSAQSTTDPIIAAKLHTPRSRTEKASIDKLKRVISIQEDRLENIEGKQIPSLLESAKACLKEDKKKEALKCLAHKKRLERMVDTIKAAVFNMETQMFMLESAIEDRHVKKALDEAASAMAGLQQNIGDPNTAVVDLKDMSASLPELEIGDATDEELMEELEQWLSPEDKRKSEENKNDDNISLLSMPSFLPAAPESALTPPSVDRILNAVVGE